MRFSQEPVESPTRDYPGLHEQVYMKLLFAGSCQLTLWDGAKPSDYRALNKCISSTASQLMGVDELMFKPVAHITEPSLSTEDDPKRFEAVEAFFTGEKPKQESIDDGQVGTEQSGEDEQLEHRGKLLVLYGADFNRRSECQVPQSRLDFLSGIVKAKGRSGLILVTGTDPYGGRRGFEASEAYPDQVFYGSLGTGREPIISEDREVEVPELPVYQALRPSCTKRDSEDEPPKKGVTVHHYGKTRLGLPNLGQRENKS
jgi:hypothetical protein